MSNTSRRPRITARRLALAAGVLMAGLAAATLPAVAASPAMLRLTPASFGATQPLSLDVNKSVIVDLPADVREVIVGQPGVATTIMRSKRRAIIQGTAAGSTNIIFLDDAGRTVSVIDIDVLDTSANSADSTALEEAIRRIVSGSQVRVESFGERVVLSGTVPSGDDMQKVMAIATQFTGSADNVANVLSVGGGQQVMLKVTIAEVSREVVKQLGINLSATASVNGVTFGLANTNGLGGASGVVTTNGVSAGFSTPGFSLDASLKALERRGAVHMLAEPTLTAMSGQEAEFLAGGQFPVPSGIDNGVLSFEYKTFGVNLKFTPTVRSDGQIGLAVDTSVSEPTTQGGLNIGTLTIPAVRDRRAKTSVELPTGATLSIAGIFQDEIRQQINQLPGVGDIPILGALFRSRDFIHSQTELVVLVTPYIAEAGPRPVLPTERSAIAGDAEAIFLGRIENMYGVGHDSKATIRGGYHGSVGFVLD